MKILFAVWEIAPFFRLGGLGDVARSLPGALKEIGVDTRVIVPFYKALKIGNIKKTKVGTVKVPYGGRDESVIIYEISHPFAHYTVYLLRCEKYLDIARGIDTFAFFDKTVVEIIKNNSLNFIPDIIHCNDNHTGFIPLLVKEAELSVKTLLTIHNLAYQGRTSCDILDKLGISKHKSRLIEWEIKSQQINMLMEGVVHADIVSTVSPTYAKEIMTEKYGCGLEEILRGKEGRVFGVLNGIDVNKTYLHRLGIEEGDRIHVDNMERKKRINKLRLQKNLGLKVSDKIPLSCFIGRFDPWQKGIDILHKMLLRLDLTKNQFIILGTGNHDWEERYQWLAKFYPSSISCNLKFDERLAYKIYAASDFIMIPSRFEPCGLIQMMAMYFGTLPIAHKTGGLIDSIKDGLNGFLFDAYSSEDLERSYNHAIDIYHRDSGRLRAMIQAAITTDFSWHKSAEEYLNLYQKLTNGEL